MYTPKVEFRMLKKPDGTLVLQYRQNRPPSNDFSPLWSMWTNVPTVELEETNEK